MNVTQIITVLLALGLFLLAARVLGAFFARLRQPPLIGEILAGILIGPFVLGSLSPDIFNAFFNFGSGGDSSTVVNGLYWLGIVLLMFLTGSEVRNLLSKQNRRPTAVLLAVGTPLPFTLVIVLGLVGVIPLGALVGEKESTLAALLVLASAATVTSIPVISRIFHDLGIMKTRFASLILGSAVIEDIFLWSVLAFAISYASSVSIDGGVTSMTFTHVALNIIYVTVALMVMPKLLSLLRRAEWNWLYRRLPIVYLVAIVALYLVAASMMQTSLVFAAFLAGFGVVGGVRGQERRYIKRSLAVIDKLGYAIFIPIYFALVGYRLVFDGTFSLTMFLVFLVGSSVLVIAAMSLAARAAGFKGLSVVNIAVAANARGGPGIVLASAAYEAGIIGSAFYTTLVLAALVTSQFAGWWLQYVLHKKWPLLTTGT